ncbi:RNA 2'-phosphotransferase [Collimonas fungivorans]|uniref:RNA 2'-phosphotransferase n=1 Tax=Collimonas fungivorans TaxID=158899 RepID=UPI0009ED647C|nr:RNA 2'-phosphotransferase [Collimonas fungivorans]
MNNGQKKFESGSKFLSLVLRHKPEQIGLILDSEGWASVDELVKLSNANGQSFDRQTIEAIVAESDKQRFALSRDGLRIRANQGHSVNVSLGLEPIVPPDTLYHGTASRFLPSIELSGLHSAQRLKVHLSSDASVAEHVGARHGKPIVLIIDAQAMSADGHLFYLSQNGVWLTDAVPVNYIRGPLE